MNSSLTNLFMNHNYTVGMIYIFAQLLGFFINMKKFNVPDGHSYVLLLCMAILAKKLV